MVKGTVLEKRQVYRLVGSNPTLSATISKGVFSMSLLPLIVLGVLIAFAMKLEMDRSAVPRCGDCGLRMSRESGTCVACGGRRR